MKNRIVHLGIAATLAWLLPAALPGGQLQQGTWSGTWLNAYGNNARPRNVSIEVKTSPDPHWRWRSSQGGELLSATFTGLAGGQQGFALSDMRLDEGVLSFSFQREDLKVKCRLELGEEGAYEGDCSAGDGKGGRLTLSPPEPSSEQ